MEVVKNYFSIAQAAEYVGVTVQAVYAAIDDDRLVAIQIGGKPFIFKKELNRWKRERERTRAQSKPNGKEATNG